MNETSRSVCNLNLSFQKRSREGFNEIKAKFAFLCVIDWIRFPLRFYDFLSRVR